ncbi:MAG: VapC toxin family PIN domain ribonuclease [Anaerolineae bacterium]|nr:MAG: VapC toxin family PIN domain ribonuclease [Anaerolineae bacterium]
MVSASYLLDTNAISEPLRPSPDARLMDKLRENDGRVAIAAVVWHELLYGCRRLPESRRRAAIERYLFDVVALTIPILPYDDRGARWHADERARLSVLGLVPSFADGQIAAIAAVNGLTLVTANTAHFTNFAGLEVTNWLGE